MHSRSMTCGACGTINGFVVEGRLHCGEEVRCSRCRGNLGTWGDLVATSVAGASGRFPVAASFEAGSPGSERRSPC